LEKDQEKHIKGIKKNSSKLNDNNNIMSDSNKNAFVHRRPLIASILLLLEQLLIVVSVNIGNAHSYDVFLGGSCNPTTWRKDLAVPFLQEVGVSFYNPVSTCIQWQLRELDSILIHL